MRCPPFEDFEWSLAHPLLRSNTGMPTFGSRPGAACGFVLEGSVRKSGNALRVTVQLASTSDGYQLWSRRYERKLQDLFAVQDEIALAIADMLRVKTATQPQALPGGNASNFEAYEWYLRGRHHLNRQTREEFHRAIECFEEASARSPGYAPGTQRDGRGLALSGHICHGCSA